MTWEELLSRILIYVRWYADASSQTIWHDEAYVLWMFDLTEKAIEILRSSEDNDE